VTAAPETFLVDASGVVRWKYSGALSQRVIDTQLIPELDKVERANADAQNHLPAAP
jgi:cytochrome c biogenesis protein CcmG/thiol:disulfide interchange protein DsbE